jgi:hypothetical protein
MVPVAFFAVHRAHYRTPPQGSIIIDDPMEKYYKSLSPGEEPDADRIIVAMESSAICSIFVLIDNSQKRECILNSGCQIIAMSKTSCHDLGLMYNPAIILHMQTANKDIDQLLGLFCNVLFQIGPITFYLQVHIIRSPAYDVQWLKKMSQCLHDLERSDWCNLLT